MLIIWLCYKIYCKLLHTLLCPLQHIEVHDVEKTSATFHSKPQDKQHLPEVVVVNDSVGCRHLPEVVVVNDSVGCRHLPEVVVVNDSVGCRLESSHRYNFFSSHFYLPFWCILLFIFVHNEFIASWYCFTAYGLLEKYAITHLIGIGQAWQANWVHVRSSIC